MFHQRERQRIALLGGMSAGAFWSRHWQKQPLFVRRALPGFRDPLTPDDLTRLSTEPFVDSRLVLEQGGRRPWEVVPGPQSEARLRRLPRSHWTLLVENADAHVERLADLLDRFAFLPRWRIDDVMVSLAAPGGSVGPHIDRYDVFLLQGRGRRRWQIDAAARDVFRPGLDLQILDSFAASAEWVAEPGDLLYLPPGLAHYGVALEQCLTYSIGFRAPDARGLLFSCLERLARRPGLEVLYRDQRHRPSHEPAEIEREAIAKLERMVTAAWEQSRGNLPLMLGEILTEPRIAGAPRRRRLRPEDVRERLRPADAQLVRSPGSKAAYRRSGRAATLFVDGRSYSLDPKDAAAAQALTRSRRIPASTLAPLLPRRSFQTLLADLINLGCYSIASPRARARRGGPVPAPRSRRARGSR